MLAGGCRRKREGTVEVGYTPRDHLAHKALGRLGWHHLLLDHKVGVQHIYGQLHKHWACRGKKNTESATLPSPQALGPYHYPALCHLPGVPDWATAIAVLRVGMMSRTLRTEAQNLQSGWNKDI